MVGIAKRRGCGLKDRWGKLALSAEMFAAMIVAAAIVRAREYRDLMPFLLIIPSSSSYVRRAELYLKRPRRFRSEPLSRGAAAPIVHRHRHAP